jgi:hypothetical protein
LVEVEEKNYGEANSIKLSGVTENELSLLKSIFICASYAGIA